MKVSVITLGCKVNEYESQSILNQLLSNGYEITEGLAYADVYVVNTCAVTNVAERKSRQVLAKIEKLNPDAKIIMCGCAVQNNPKQFLKNKNVLSVLGNAGKDDIMNFVNKHNETLVPLSNIYTNMLRPISTRARQFIKIQDGCDNFCSYCIIPYIRGRSRSRNISDIIDEIINTKANEIVLTGINMSDYQIDDKPALKTLISEIDKLNKRFRISSLECNVLNDELLQILKDAKNFCPHFHLSLQSACNDTLKRMNRHYTIEEFISITDKIKNMFQNVCISTDIIVGFKQESDDEFNTTYNNLKRIGFSFMHIFPYSERAGTSASRLSGNIDKCVIKNREKRLQELNNEFVNDFFNSNINTSHKVLIEEYFEDFSVGYTENYIYTFIPEKINVGEIVDVILEKQYNGGMIARRK